jgi:hypothetical protein
MAVTRAVPMRPNELMQTTLPGYNIFEHQHLGRTERPTGNSQEGNTDMRVV